LDEPNSSLDDEAERSLNQALILAKQKSCTTVVITHRSNLIQVADYLLVIESGMVKRFGRRDDILSDLQKAKSQAAASQIKDSSVGGRS
jgi:ABC-type protease/lipase transport system fused ATPase/permease subunit